MNDGKSIKEMFKLIGISFGSGILITSAVWWFVIVPATASDSLNNARAKVTELTESLRSTELTAGELKDEATELRASSKQNLEEIEYLNAALTGLTGRLEGIVTEFRETKGKLIRAERDITTLESGARENTARITELNGIVAELRETNKQLEAITSRISDLNGEIGSGIISADDRTQSALDTIESIEDDISQLLGEGG